MKIITVLPSRGLIHSRTMEKVIKNLSMFPESTVLFSHVRPIPEAQNHLVDEALKLNPDYIWMVEEDNVFPCDILFEMVSEKKPVVTVDYPVGEKQYSTIMRKNGEILWCGFGCTLIQKTVFDALEKPYFRTDISYRLKNHGGDEFVKENTEIKYGGHDINFGMALREKGIPIYQMPHVISGHLRVMKEGERETNHGFHQIVEYNQILNYQEH